MHLSPALKLCHAVFGLLHWSKAICWLIKQVSRYFCAASGCVIYIVISEHTAASHAIVVH